MLILVIYLYVIAGIATFLVIRRYLVIVLRFILHPTGPIHAYFSRHVALPFLIRKRRLWGPVTRLRAIWIFTQLAATAPCNIVGVHNVVEARQRSGSLAVIHIALLCVFPHASFGAALLYVSLSTYHQIHISIGIMAIVQSLLHILLALQATSFDISLRLFQSGLTAIISIAVSSLLMLPWLRHRIYEFCIKMHVLLGILATIAILIHLKQKLQLDGYFLIGSLGLLVALAFLYVLDQIYRNRTKTGGPAIAEKEEVKGAVRITFTPCKPWSVRAGQYIHLRIPGVCSYSFAESHPMNILWWEEDTASGVASRITLLAEVQSGFTRRLKSNKHGSFRVLIDGPYGKSKDMEHYDSFLFVCTGIGITAQLLYIKELITKQRHGYRLRKVLLIWQVEERDHGEWIKQYMDMLLDLDKGTNFVLRWALFKSSGHPEDTRLDLNGRRGYEHCGRPDIAGILHDEFNDSQRKILLVVSSDPLFRDKYRRIAVRESQRVDLYETEYQPNQSSGGFWAPMKPVFEMETTLRAIKAKANRSTRAWEALP